MPKIEIYDLNLNLVNKPTNNETHDMMYEFYFDVYNEEYVRRVVIENNKLVEIHNMTQPTIRKKLNNDEEIIFSVEGYDPISLFFSIPESGPIIKVSLVQLVKDCDPKRDLCFYQRQSITAVYCDEERISMIMRADLRVLVRPNIYGYIKASDFNTSDVRKQEVINSLKTLHKVIQTDADMMSKLYVRKNLAKTRSAPYAVRLNGADFDENGYSFKKEGGKTWESYFGLHPQSFFTLRNNEVATDQYYEHVLNTWLCQHNITPANWIKNVQTTNEYHYLSAVAYVVTVFCSSAPYVTDFKWIPDSREKYKAVDIDCYLLDDLQGDCEDAAGRALYFIMDIYKKGLKNTWINKPLLNALFIGLKRLGFPLAIAGTAHQPHQPSDNGSNHMYAALLPIPYFTKLFPNKSEWHPMFRDVQVSNPVEKATYIEGILLSTPFHHAKKQGDHDIELVYKSIHDNGYMFKPCNSNLQRPYFLDTNVEICHESLRCFSPVLQGNCSRVFKERSKSEHGILFKDLLEKKEFIETVKTAEWDDNTIQAEQKLLKWFAYPLYVDKMEITKRIVITRHHVIRINYQLPKPPEGYTNYVYINAWKPLSDEQIKDITTIIRRLHPNASNCMVYNNLWGYKYIWWFN